jgi:hypothetical protein
MRQEQEIKMSHSTFSNKILALEAKLCIKSHHARIPPMGEKKNQCERKIKPSSSVQQPFTKLMDFFPLPLLKHLF